MDTSVFKDSTSQKGFWGDAFNVGTIASYGNPVTDTNVGQITNTRSASRVLQLHYSF